MSKQQTQQTQQTQKRKLIQNIQYVNPASVQHNMAIAEYCRTSISALSGVVAGILGLTGLAGFAFYIVCALFLFGGLLLKSGTEKTETNQYFLKRTQLLTNGLWGAMFTYILSWTFLYSLVHVY